MSPTVKGNILLVITAAIWGSAFVFQKVAAESISALSFNAIRFSLAFFALLPLLLLPQKMFNPEVDEGAGAPIRRSAMASCWVAGGVAGAFMFLAIWLQQVGLSYTTSGKAGFLTATSIVIVPILAIFIGQRCTKNVALGSVLTLAGIYVLTLSKGDNAEMLFNFGDVLVLISAFGWAGQVLWLSIVAKRSNVLKIAIIQMGTVGALSCIAMYIEHFLAGVKLPTWDIIWQARWQIFYTGVISAAIAFTLQIVAQRYVSAINAVLIMSLESVFAMLSGILFLGDKLTESIVFGCGFIFIGITISQLSPNFFQKRKQ